MKFLKCIQDNTLIVCENDYKKFILKKLHEDKLFLNVKILSKNEFLNNYLFKYDEKTLAYLINKYNFKVSIAKDFLRNMLCLDNEFKQSEKLEFLINLKNELDNNNLLIYNDEFKNRLKKSNVLVIGYPYLEKYELNIFNSINAKIINDNDNLEIDKVYEFKNQDDEINFVCKSICKLINDGIDINQIKLVNVSNDYYNDLERMFNFYNIPIKIDSEETLFGNVIAQKFLENYTSDMAKNIDFIKTENNDIVKKIINICNKYVFEKNAEKIKKLIIEEFKNTKMNSKNQKNYVEIVDLFYPFDDNYVFLMNFNTGAIPKSFKDEEYITDDIKCEVEMFSTNEKNRIFKNNTINKIKSIKNLIITYKLKSNKGEFYPSSIIKDLNLKIEGIENDILNSYSKEFDKINYAKMNDDYLKYGTLNNNYFIYKNSLGNILYNTYDNKFKGIDNNSLKEYLKGKLTLSYSSLNNYNKCAFRYYLANILKLDKYEENFEAFIGSLFHDVLEKCLINNLSVEDEVNKYILDKNKELTIKERFFIDKIMEDIKFAINILNKQKEYISLDQTLYEKDIVIDKSRDILVEFIGFVDKILYKENKNDTYVSIIDYKTGFIDVELKYLPYGLSLQLPIYLYLVKKSNLFKNPKFVGFYLQYILDKDIKRDIKKDYEEERANNLKLMGYSNSDIHALREFDSSYANSNLIKGLKTKTNGEFGAYSKILNDNEIEKIIELTEKNIDEGITRILNGDFTINPKKIGYDKDLGCMYCKFKDICNKKENDYVILEDILNLDFLRGDENA